MAIGRGVAPASRIRRAAVGRYRRPAMARCPNCSEPVSQFAAGCAVCGADLEAARRSRASRRRIALPRLPAVPQDLVILTVMSLVTLAAPILGVLLSVLVIRRERATSQRPLRATLWVVVVVGAVLIALPATRFGGLLSALAG